MMEQKEKYYIWLTQSGEGCDYTIGCGERLVPLKLDNLEDREKVNAEVLRILDYYGVDIEEARIFRFIEDALPIIEEFEQIEEEKEKALERERKLKELERLKKELGVD